ncbi:MAG: molybdopterin-synthase adenylyltransferase MoeB [Dissulfurispiraceae bacterium]|jgi:adenylyltransferase/sulfurtransferase|nr:molybdopterin-synthase adenylyltransferase MoeB [Dissulfurispiraceae bacterium]
MKKEFTPEQLQRYHRQIILSDIGLSGQQKISEAKVFIAGAGGLGSAAGYYLAAAGIGRLCAADNDVVDLSNLQRQIAHNTERIGMNKTESAGLSFKALNPDIDFIAMPHRITADNIAACIKDYDIIVDCSDNLLARYLLNDASVMMKKPLVSGAVSGFAGHVTTVIPGQGHCFRCIFEALDPDDEALNSQSGILGAFAGVIGSLQALEVLKLVTGIGKPLVNALLVFDGLKSEIRRVNVDRNRECPVCGDNPLINIPGCL